MFVVQFNEACVVLKNIKTDFPRIPEHKQILGMISEASVPRCSHLPEISVHTQNDQA